MSLLRATLVSGDFTLHLLLGLFWRTSLQNTSGQLLLKFFTRRLRLRFSCEGKGKYPIFGNVLHWYYKKYLLELKKKKPIPEKIENLFCSTVFNKYAVPEGIHLQLSKDEQTTSLVFNTCMTAILWNNFYWLVLKK